MNFEEESSPNIIFQSFLPVLSHDFGVERERKAEKKNKKNGDTLVVHSKFCNDE
jgi:hypothetical protein